MNDQWNTLPSDQVIAETRQNLEDHGFVVEVVETSQQALELLKIRVPNGAQVMTGSSTTLSEIGFMDYLQSPENNWINLQQAVWSENDDKNRAQKRREATAAQYFLASANAISQTGALIFCDASGSRTSALPYAAEHVILVVGANKITDSLESGMQRVREFVFPLEDKRAQAAYGMGSSLAKWVILERETTPNRTTVVLVKEKLGY